MNISINNTVPKTPLAKMYSSSTLSNSNMISQKKTVSVDYFSYANALPSPAKTKLQSTSFKGLDVNVKIARKTVREFHNEFGVPHSGSFIRLKIYNHNADKKHEKLIEQLKKLSEEYGYALVRAMNNLDSEINFTKITRPQILERLEHYVKKSHAANCDQQAEIINNRLKRQGVSIKNIDFRIYNKSDNKARECGGHSFNVIGMSKFAKITNPKTWGGNSVIVDTWGNIAEPTDTGLKYLKEMFSFNSEKEYLVFEDKDILLDQLYQRMFAERKNL